MVWSCSYWTDEDGGALSSWWMGLMHRTGTQAFCTGSATRRMFGQLVGGASSSRQRGSAPQVQQMARSFGWGFAPAAASSVYARGLAPEVSRVGLADRLWLDRLVGVGHGFGEQLVDGVLGRCVPER